MLERVGGFRKEYDGAQDYDFIFRCTQAAGKIHHIPEILYHWRTHQSSTAVSYTHLDVYKRQFLYYVPYTCLTAMTFPAILYATKSPLSALAGFVMAVLLALKKKSLVTVALFSCGAVFVAERIMELL